MSRFYKCYSYFFSKNISPYAIFKDQNFNNTLTNNIVSFEQLGPGVLLKRSKLAKFCHDSMQNLLSQLSMPKWFKNFLFIGFKKFPKVIMATDYAKIDRVGSFAAGFEQVPLVQNF